MPTRQPTPDPTPQPSPRPSPVPTRETPEPSRAPQAPPPTANPPGGQCIVNVSLEQCPPLMQSQEIIEGCDCYNFCNGGSIACCQFGEACSIDCTGALVAVSALQNNTVHVSSPLDREERKLTLDPIAHIIFTGLYRTRTYSSSSVNWTMHCCGVPKRLSTACRESNTSRKLRLL